MTSSRCRSSGTSRPSPLRERHRSDRPAGTAERVDPPMPRSTPRTTPIRSRPALVAPTARALAPARSSAVEQIECCRPLPALDRGFHLRQQIGHCLIVTPILTPSPMRPTPGRRKGGIRHMKPTEQLTVILPALSDLVDRPRTGAAPERDAVRQLRPARRPRPHDHARRRRSPTYSEAKNPLPPRPRWTTGSSLPRSSAGP